MGVNDAECLAELGLRGWIIDGHEWAEQTAVHLGVEDGDADAVGSEHVGVRVRKPVDQTFASQAAQAASMALTGLAAYGLVWVVIAAGVDDRVLLSALACYLVGALVGLFSRLYADFGADNGIDDFGLSTMRQIAAPLLSGMAVVLGVELVALAGAAQSCGAGALVQAFDFSKNSATVLSAAVFGLTPGLVLDRLNQRAESFKEDLKGQRGARVAYATPPALTVVGFGTS